MSRVDPSRVQSIERAFAVLAALRDGPIGVTDVAERARLPKSTAARLLGSLAHEGVVEQVPGETRYRLGPKIVTLAAGVRPTRSLVALARPYLIELAESAGEVAGLSVPDGFLAHYVDQVDSPHPVGVRDWTGTRIPMHTASSGIMLLAHFLPVELERYLAEPLQRFTPRTVVDPAQIRARIRRAQVDGFAWTRDEYADGISSVAAAIADEDGEVIGAIHVHGPSYRFPRTSAEESLAAEVVATAARITERVRQTAGSAG
jgi:IclR family transcriptional regulator, acetate operon repressor